MLHKKQQHIKDIYGKEPETLNEIAESVIAVINQKRKVAGFAWDVKYTERVSNSHTAPITGYSNFLGKRTINSYPGFAGRVWIRYSEPDPNCFGSEVFPATLTYTGTGGSGSYSGLWGKISLHAGSANHKRDKNIQHPGVDCLSWDYRFFLQDFPGILDEVNARIIQFEKEVAWDKLMNRYIHSTFYYSHKFEWEDPTIKAMDDKFLLKIENERRK